jgi:SAM-dependent methyltransferase
MLKKILPKSLRKYLIKKTRFPHVGDVQPFDLFSTEPISKSWGGDRGTPIDRYFIEKFLSDNSDIIKGSVLEFGDDFYTSKFGGEKVITSETFNTPQGNGKATYIGNLEEIPQIKSDYFDAVICTQTLHFVPDMNKAISTIYRILKPGGTLLATMPGISQIETLWVDYWRVTKYSAQLLFEKSFEKNNMEISHFGNVFAASSFLYGISAEELEKKMLDKIDENYHMLICIKAIKS